MEKVETHSCYYCQKEFKRESTLNVHMCEPKRRFHNKNDKGVVLGMHTFDKFYKYAQNHTGTKTFDEFIHSPYYIAFVKFGNYCIKTKCIKIDRFIEFVVTSGIKLDKWATDDTYTQFLARALKTENVNDALARAIEYSIDWGTEKSMRPEDVMRYATSNRLCSAIISGKISPWVIYQSMSGQEFLGRLSDEQRILIWDIIDPDYWDITFANKLSDVEYVEEILKNAGW